MRALRTDIDNSSLNDTVDGMMNAAEDRRGESWVVEDATGSPAMGIYHSYQDKSWASSSSGGGGEAFARIDSNHDGVIDRNEFTEAYQERIADREGGREGGKRSPLADAKSELREWGEGRGAGAAMSEGGPSAEWRERARAKVAAGTDLCGCGPISGRGLYPPGTLPRGSERASE